ncbi:Methylthioribose-1-phosphate isomerase [Microthyrium microscopicum]|uniref:Methylthioribose-1-phosphate isomerase n=1 Tax=Microthyrium microscopicum TaxID=703497 RepID=A0A6A6TTF3_9PEZI|nr:Methylthioribose-1-phosphate isomerase [Microthyrium microscopicum]
MNVLQAIRYTPGDSASLQILDQLQLPHRSEYEDIPSATEGWAAIKEMKTRGAPAIAIVAALSLAVELAHNDNIKSADASKTKEHIQARLKYLVTSRPTAVNLEDAARKLSALVEAEATKENATGLSVRQTYIKASEQMLVDDVKDNEAIGRNGAEWILKHVSRANKRGANVITHCNTGSLATAGYGTALGVIRALQASNKLSHAYCTETRPYNQGSRLTAYELAHDKIPSTLITDSMAAALMNLNLNDEDKAIDAIVVGADRVTANGDTANKIGTYSLVPIYTYANLYRAVLAKRHGAKFLVAAPRTSIDLTRASGKDITIEHRAPDEVILVKGPVFDGTNVQDEAVTVSTAPRGINVWNPAFDVTPAELIDGIVTEAGVVEKDESGNFPLSTFFGN